MACGAWRVIPLINSDAYKGQVKFATESTNQIRAVFSSGMMSHASIYCSVFDPCL